MEIAELYGQWLARHAQLWQAMLGRGAGEPAPTVAASEPGDRRFSHPAWTDDAFYDYLRQAYLINAETLKRYAELVAVGDEEARRRLRFLARQYADAMSPANFAVTNPEFVIRALETQGESIRRGIANLLADLERRRIAMSDEAAFGVGRNLAVTPGAVVFQNEIMQLIQYAPSTERAAKRPLVIVPPCINKYYILDLQPENSFVRYAVAQGQTVFLVSWRNPREEQGHLGWDDYLEAGVLKALAVAKAIARSAQVNALGFCVGGTLLASALAVARGRGESPAASVTLLTTLLDFSEPGEIGCFVDEASVRLREETIGKGGLMRGAEFSAVFSALRANDLIWPYVVGNYLKGDTPPAFDLLYWNADATNLPGPFAAWYLRHMYLENALREPGRLRMAGVPVDLGRIDIPAFLLATREDHIVPWQAAYASRNLLGGETTFVLGAAGHVAGVVNPAARNKRCHWVNGAPAADAAAWLAAATEIKGSWWPCWSQWLWGYSGGEVGARAQPGNKAYPPGEAAPGSYVAERI